MTVPLGLPYLPMSYLDTDGTLAADSDSKVASQKAVKTYADTMVTAPASPVQGDIMYYNGSAWARLPIGTAGQLLRTNSGVTTPEWATIVSSGSNAAQIMQNITITATVSAKALTVSVKNFLGNDCSASDYGIVSFRSATITSGQYVIRNITSALSVTLSSGSTLGFTAAEAGRIYAWLIDNAGTVELALSRTADIFPESGLVSTTAEGGAGAADSATVMYSTTARSNVACRCLGYVDVVTGATAGEWDNAPTVLQLMGVGVARTGEVVQQQSATTTSVVSGSTQMPLDNTIPQNTEGVEMLTCSITPRSAVNILHITTFTAGVYGSAAVGLGTIALFQDATANALAASIGASHRIDWNSTMYLFHKMKAGTTSSTTFKVRIGANAAGTTYINISSGYTGGVYGGVEESALIIYEIAA